MARLLIKELPRIISKGRYKAAQMLEWLSSGMHFCLQNNKLVLPDIDVGGWLNGCTPQILNVSNSHQGVK